MKRLIKTVINAKTGEIVHSDLLFKTQKGGQEIRKLDKQTFGDDFCCYECGQFIETTSRNKNVFFRHKKNYSPCDLTDNYTNKQDESEINFINRIKAESQDCYQGKRSPEGERHYRVKNQIVAKLKRTEGVTEVQYEKVVKRGYPSNSV